jgi:DNA primase
MTKLRIDIKKLLAAHVEDIHQRGGDEVSIDCYKGCWTAMSKGSSDSMYVNTTTGLYICYRCGENGNAVKLIANLTGVTFDQAAAMLQREVRHKLDDMDKLKDMIQDTDPSLAAPDEYKYARRLPPEYLPLPPIKMDGSAVRAYEYLRGRRITDDMMQRYQLGYCLTGRFQGRVIAPVLSYGRPIYFVARDFTGRKEAKVLTPVNVEGKLRASDVVYNLDEATTQPRGVIVEGWTDAVATRGAALLGKRISPVQLGLLRTAGAGKWRDVVIMFDADDPDALAKANIAARVLSMYFPVSLADLPVGKDPASVDNPAPYIDDAEEFDAVTRATLKIRRALL